MTRLGAAGDVPDLTVVIPTVDRLDGRIASLASIIPLVESDDLHAEIIKFERVGTACFGSVHGVHG